MLAEPVVIMGEVGAHEREAWVMRLEQVAAMGSRLCLNLPIVQSAVCTITGKLDQLVVNLACTAMAEQHVAELLQYANDTLLPSLERNLGIQFEVRNLHFSAAGRESLAAALEYVPAEPVPAARLNRASNRRAPTPYGRVLLSM